MELIKECISGLAELYVNSGKEMPEPIRKDRFKGNIAYRTTSDRHYHLAKLAQQKHVSMNKALDMLYDAGMQQLQA